MSTLAPTAQSLTTCSRQEGNTPPDSVLAPNLPTAPVGAAFGTIAATAQTATTAGLIGYGTLTSGINVA